MVHGYSASRTRAKATNALVADCWEECAEACEMCCDEACGCCGTTVWGITLLVFSSLLMLCCFTKSTGVVNVLLWILVVIGDLIFVPAVIMAIGSTCRVLWCSACCAAHAGRCRAIAAFVSRAAASRCAALPHAAFALRARGAVSCDVCAHTHIPPLCARRSAGTRLPSPAPSRSAPPLPCASAHAHGHAGDARAAVWRSPWIALLGTIAGIVSVIRGNVALALCMQVAAISMMPFLALPWEDYAVAWSQHPTIGPWTRKPPLSFVVGRLTTFRETGV